MTVVALQINQPVNGQRFAGTGSVHMIGLVRDPEPAGLFFKWYSSLSSVPLATTLDFTTAPALTVGSQIVTFTAKDVDGDTPPDVQSVQRAGMAGGPAVAQSPCIIHIFLANMTVPTAANPTLSRAAPVLGAEAPFSWDKPDYQQVNRLRYRWRLALQSAPPGTPPTEMVPAADELTFRPVQIGDPPGTVPQVLYNKSLPSSLVTGNYILILRVEDSNDAGFGAESALGIVLNP